MHPTASPSITALRHRVVDYLAELTVDATFTVLRWLYTPEDLPRHYPQQYRSCRYRQEGDCMTDTTNATIGEAAQDYARHLSVAVLKAGACGRVHVQSPGSVTTASAQHEQWPSLRLHLCRQEVAIYCVPTSDGVVLVIAAAGHPSRYLPTWGAPAQDFAAPAYTIARDLVSHH